VDRRTLITAGAATTAVAMAAGPARATRRTAAAATFVLVHGAWHGGWCWKYVREILQGQGHRVFSPTLTGQGERSHLSRPDVDIGTHITDIVRVIEAEELSNVLLVGHSYGGMVIAGVAERAANRLKRLIFLDALLPVPGQAAFRLTPEIEKLLIGGYELAPFPADMFGVPKNHPLHPWVARQLTPMPVKTLTAPNPVSGAWAEMAKTFIECSANTLDQPKAGAARARAEKWDYHVLATGHDAMVTSPDALAKLLVGLA
jgi:pimeloyl-ACP methyl ester carboxylesterase